MRFVLTCIILLQLSFFLGAQVYHFETGKVISGDKPGLYNFKEGTYNGFAAEYSILLAKEKHLDPDSKLISIPVIRIPSYDIDSSSYPIFLLHGGPGESNLKKEFLYDELLRYHDIVIVGYRGVDGQVKLECNSIKKALFSPNLTLENSEEVFSTSLADCINELNSKGIDYRGYTIDALIQDICTVKSEFNYQSLAFLSFSFGTIIAQQFTLQYPNMVESMVLVGARPAYNLSIEGQVFDEQLYKFYKCYSDSCGQTRAMSKDSLLILLSNLLNVLPESEFSVPRFIIFAFSKLYTVNSVELFLSAIHEFYNGQVDALLNLYNEFYEVYPGDVLLGDVYMKKQHNSPDSILSLEDSSIGNLMAEQLNWWFSPKSQFYSSSYEQVSDTTFIESLFICGDLDVASPPALLNEIKPYYQNATFIEISRCGHLDFFFEQKPYVDSLIINFFEE